jgi:hypothetical protein
MKKISNLKRAVVLWTILSGPAVTAIAVEPPAKAVQETAQLIAARADANQSVQAQAKKVEELRKSYMKAVDVVAEKKEALRSAEQSAFQQQMKLGPRSMFTMSYNYELGQAEKAKRLALNSYVEEQMKQKAVEASYAIKDYRFLLRKKDADASIRNEMRTVYSLTRAKRFAEAKALADEIAKFESEISQADKSAGPDEAIQELQGLIADIDVMKQKADGDAVRITELANIEKQLRSDLEQKTTDLAQKTIALEKANAEIQSQKEAVAAAISEKTAIMAKLSEAESALQKLEARHADMMSAKTLIEEQLAQCRKEATNAILQRDAYKNQGVWSKIRGVNPLPAAK